MIKLKNSSYDKETGISVATINTEIGEFTAYAKLHPADKDIESTYCGCEYAEIRAIIKYFKAKMQILSYEIKGLSDGINVLKSLKGYNPYLIENRKLRKRLYILNKSKKELGEKIKSLQSKLCQRIELRGKYLEKINKQKEEKS